MRTLNQNRAWSWRWRLLLTLVLLMVGGMQGLAGARDEYLADPVTGLALSGYDPVAYFIDNKARRGKAAHELAWMGHSWRFVNKGNMHAFKDNPDVYAPQYGGYGALMAARGYRTEGNPEIWTVFRNKLYVFHSTANRFTWFSDPDLFKRRADENFAYDIESPGN